MSETSSKSLISSIERATEVLMLFTRSARPDLGVTEVSQSLGMSKSVVHRVLATLASRDFLEIDPDTHRYRLGHAVMALGSAYADHLDIRILAKATLQTLADSIKETVALSQRYGWERSYVDQASPRGEAALTVAIGHRFPLHAGAASKAFLAFLPRDECERYLSQHLGESLAEEAWIDPALMREDLEAIRERGYAVSEGPRASHVAVPVLGPRGNPVAALSVCGPRERFPTFMDQAIAELTGAAEDLSRRVGGTPEL